MNKIDITFEVKNIIFRDTETGYTLANVNLISHPKDVEIPTAEPIISGYFNAIHVKDELKAIGKWVDTGVNGYRFEIETSQLIFPETDKGMIEFIVRFANGVGKVSARRIVEAFKENTFNVIINNPERLLEIKGITKKRAESVHMSISQYKDYEEVALFLVPLGFSHTDTVLIYDEFGYGAIDRIRSNPYVLCKYNKIDFSRVDESAKKLGFKANNQERIKEGIMLYINTQMKNRGDIFVYEKDIIDDLSSFLKKYGAFEKYEALSEDEVKLALKNLDINKRIKKDIDSNGNKITYISFYKFIEDEIVRLLNDMVNQQVPYICYKRDIDAFIENYEQKNNMTLAEKQKDALFMITSNKISILSGGPGTGKTQTINAIIELYRSVNPSGIIKLAAPTGRAAKRMTELTGMEAKTIHRLIGLNSFQEDKSELNEIEADFLIIDEASMIDAYVFYNLLSVIPEETRLLIVGDYQQLPSVGPGLVLRDLIDSNTIKTTILTEVFRQAKNSQIVTNSHKIISGDKDINLDMSKGDFYFIDELMVNKISQKVLKSIYRLLKSGYSMDEIQVLSVMNKGDLGVVELNKKIQNMFNPESAHKNQVEIGTHRYLRENDKVMQTVNNYDLEVFNGEVGKITSINYNKKLEVVVDFEDKVITYNSDTIHELTLAYAITVHKSQGSEFDAVIMPIHQSLSILLNRNIIYTAWTRAKKRVVCVGDREELNKGIDRIDNTIRNSQIKNKLINPVLYMSS